MKLINMNMEYIGPLGNPMVFEKGINGDVFFSHSIACAIVAMFQGKSPQSPDAPLLTTDDHLVMFGITEKLVEARRAESTSLDLVAEEVTYLRRMRAVCLHPVVAGYLFKGLAEAENTPPVGFIPLSVDEPGEEGIEMK